MENSVAQELNKNKKISKRQPKGLEQWFLEAETASYRARKEAERARKYVDGHQLTAEEIAVLKRRGQPPVVINRIRRKIEWLKGLEVKQRTDPKAFPRTPKHQADAEMVTDVIRYVCDDQDWDEIRSEAYDDFLVEGYGAVEVVHKTNKKGVVDVVINQYHWDRTFYDPHSRRSDFSDARYLGVVMWMDFDDFVEEFPKFEQSGSSLMSMDDSTNDETYDDRPNRNWSDPKRNRLRVVLIWYRKNGEWAYCKFVKGQKLEEGVSPYINDDEESICPLIFQSAFTDGDNGRYGVVRDMFDTQDEINKRRSKALHQASSRQTVGIKGAVESVEAMKEELANPDGHIEISLEAFEAAAQAGMRPFDILTNSDQIAGQFNLMQEAKQEIDLMGANAALAGETSNNTSGRAVLARQQGGMIELASLNDNYHRFNRRTYRHIWFAIRQFWTEERWVRVTDDESTVRFVGINRPVTLGEKLSKLDEARAIEMAQSFGINDINDPRLSNTVSVENKVSEIDVDILIEEVPDQITLEGETFEALLKYGPVIPPHVLIEADPALPSKRKEKLLKLLTQPPQQTPDEQLDLKDKEVTIGEKLANITKKEAEALKLMSDANAPAGEQFNVRP